MFVIATSGGGKTTLIKRIIRDDLIKNRFVVVLDIEREYKAMCEYFAISGSIWLQYYHLSLLKQLLSKNTYVAI